MIAIKIDLCRHLLYNLNGFNTWNPTIIKGGLKND